TDATLGVDDDAGRVDQLIGDEWRQRRERRRGIAPRVGDTRRPADLLGPDVGQAVGPALDEAVIAADIHNPRLTWHAGERLLRFARRQRREEQIELRK